MATHQGVLEKDLKWFVDKGKSFLTLPYCKIQFYNNNNKTNNSNSQLGIFENGMIFKIYKS